ncbi:uncharacterized protein LOC122808066 [Protopterus annectens]|uniref:uncharacterized protein LOC122808066 n=1 Tax=Protopterus annectens TaxID=7888 RepID=UPI001CFABFB7|nr:uncharacterized protein LOC122808066 [Protopterus annectens]
MICPIKINQLINKLKCNIMASGSGDGQSGSQPLFTQSSDNIDAAMVNSQDSGEANAVGNLTVLVNMLLGKVEALSQKFDDGTRTDRYFNTSSLAGLLGQLHATSRSSEAQLRLPSGSIREGAQEGNIVPRQDTNAAGERSTVNSANGVTNTENSNPSMAGFLEHKDFFVNSVNDQSGLNEHRNVSSLTVLLSSFDQKLFKCHKLQLEVAYLTECLDKKIC